uniref:Uncharacterized protein n=1 Tax=Leersia perrieri TaxID=77586 RepID=A0A0D9X0B8_9ORYZ
MRPRRLKGQLAEELAAAAEMSARMADLDQHLDRFERGVDDFGRVMDEMMEEQEELEQLFPELRQRSPWEKAKEAIRLRRRRSGAKVAPATAESEMITLGPALTRLLERSGNTQVLEEIAALNQAIMQSYA